MYHLIRRWRFHAIACALIALVIITSHAASVEAADQQIGSPVIGPGESRLLGQWVATSADGSRIASSANADHLDAEIRIYDFVEGSWQSVGEPIVPGGKLYESPMAMSSDGSLLVVGNPTASTGPEAQHRGEVRTYHFIDDAWELLGDPLIGRTGDFIFGSTVATNRSGTRVAVGLSSDRGPVRIFDRVAGSWIQSGEVTGPPLQPDTLSMSADGSRIVAARWAERGALHIFAETPNGWTPLGDPILGSLTNEQLGREVSMSADGTRIAARGLRSPNDPSAHHVSVFGDVDGQWELVGDHLTGQTRSGDRKTGFNDNFGVSLSLSGDGDRLAIGASGSGLNGKKSGNVAVFEFDDVTWQPIATFVGPHRTSAMGVGVALDGDGSRVVVGTPNAEFTDNNNGMVTVFDLGVGAPMCGGREATLVGTANNDRLIGTPGDDVIVGLQGNDVIKGLGGDDIVCAGVGNDVVFGGDGFDTLFGAQGDDQIYASSGSNEVGRSDSRGARIFGGAGDDSLYGSNRWDRIRGGPGDDAIFGYQGRDWLRGGRGMDLIDGGTMLDDLHGGDGDDIIRVDSRDRVRGGAGSSDRCEVAPQASPILVSCERG